MEEVIGILILGFIALVFAAVHDWRKHEVANWLNFALIIFALGFRFFYSFYSGIGFNFFYQGVIWLGIFFALANLFYYSRLFAGGDAKLMIALGTIIPFYSDFYSNLNLVLGFFITFFVIGSLYGLMWSFYLMLNNFKGFKKNYKIQFTKNKKFVFALLSIGLVIMILGFWFDLFFYLGVLVFLIPYLFVFAKSVDESCMIKVVKVGELVEGDWLYENVRSGKKYVKANWEGLSKEDIKLLKKHFKKIKIRQGIPFVPVFLLAYLSWLVWIFYFNGVFFF